MYIDGGNTDGSYNTDPDFQDAIIVIRWSGDKLVLTNGAYVKINASNEVGRMTITSGTSAELDASKLEVFEWIDVNAGGSINMDVDSVVTTNKLIGSGTIYIDATDFDGEEVMVINADMSGFTGTIVVNGDADYVIVDGGVKIVAKTTAQ